MDPLTLIYLLALLFILGGLVLGVLAFFTGIGASLVSFFYTIYHLLFVKEDRKKGADKEYTIRQGREIK